MNWKRIAIATVTMTAIALSCFAIVNAQTTSGTTVGSGYTLRPIQPVPYMAPWPPEFDYQAFVDQASLDLFGQLGMALTNHETVTAGQTVYAGTALFQEAGGSVSTQPFTFVLDSIDSVSNDTYTDPGSGVVVNVKTTKVHGTIFTSLGSVDAYIGALTATHPQLEEHYLVLLEPDPSSATSSAAGAAGGVSSRESADRDWNELSTKETATAAQEEEDPCDGCINAHNTARNKAVKRHKRCRNKALLFGGGATIIASFGGPWGTAGGLLGTAAAVDACNDTLKDAKDDAIGTFCECWADNGCDEDYSGYQDNCT